MKSTYILRLEDTPLIGRDKGLSLEKKLNLMEKEALFDVIEVIIPANAYTMSSSFFIGLFQESANRLLSKDVFSEKFIFTSPQYMKEVISIYKYRLFQSPYL